MSISSLSGSNAIPKVSQKAIDPLFKLINPRTGEITKFAEEAIKAAGVTLTTKLANEVNKLLQSENGWFKSDLMYFSKVSKEDYVSKLSFEQAINFSEITSNSGNSRLLPLINEVAHGIFVCGVQATMEARFASLKEAVNAGYKFKILHFVLHENDIKNVERFQKEHQRFFDENQIEIAPNTVEAYKTGWSDSGLEKLCSGITGTYAVISNEIYATKTALAAIRRLAQGEFCGVASLTSANHWLLEVEKYGFFEKFEGVSAIKRNAETLCNIFARAFNEELKFCEAIQNGTVHIVA